MPSFVITHGAGKGESVQTFPIGTVVKMVSGVGPLEAKIVAFNEPGMGEPSDPTAEDLATYTLESTPEFQNGRVADSPYDIACEDVHDPMDWQRVS